MRHNILRNVSREEIVLRGHNFPLYIIQIWAALVWENEIVGPIRQSRLSYREFRFKQNGGQEPIGPSTHDVLEFCC